MKSVVPAGRPPAGIMGSVVTVRGAAPPPKVYVGNAEPEGQTSVVGGREVVVGGWARYEADRRQAQWAAAPRDPSVAPLTRYGGRSFVTAQDVLDSLVVARVSGGDEAPALSDPLEVACDRLARGLASAEAHTSSVVRGGTVEDVEGMPLETDPEALHRLAEDAVIYAGALLGKPLELPPAPGVMPPLPTRSVRVSRARGGEANKEVAGLEAAAAVRADAVVAYRGALAGHLERAASALEAS